MDTEKEEEYFKFLTEWVANGKRYGDHIYAKTRIEAERLLANRQLTERITGYDPETTYLFD